MPKSYSHCRSSKMRFIVLSPPDASHVFTSLFLINSLAKRHNVTYYGLKKYRDIIEESGAIFSEYPKEIEENLLVASPYNLPDHLLSEKDHLLKNWEENKTILSFTLADWLKNIANEYDGIVMDVTFYQRTGFTVPCITKTLNKALIGSFSYFPRLISFHIRLTPEHINTTIQNEILFHLEYDKILSKFDMHLHDISSYIVDRTVEVYYSSSYHMGGNLSANAILIGDRHLSDLISTPTKELQKENFVYFSLGTVVNTNIQIFKEVIGFLSNTEYNVIVSSGGNNQISTALQEFHSPNIEIRNFVDQISVLTEAKIFITHAGASSVYEGLYLGVPLICIPQKFDQPMNAKRVQELGVGISINTADNISEKLKSAFKDLEENEEQYLQNIERVRQSFAQSNTPDEAVIAIELLLSQISNKSANEEKILVGDSAHPEL